MTHTLDSEKQLDFEGLVFGPKGIASDQDEYRHQDRLSYGAEEQVVRKVHGVGFENVGEEGAG